MSLDFNSPEIQALFLIPGNRKFFGRRGNIYKKVDHYCYIISLDKLRGKVLS